MRTALLTLASLLALAAPLAGQTTGPLELYWSSIDAGGTTSTSQDGSTYEVFGVIGQPDANVHSGGGFTLYGGFLNSDPGSAFAISDVSQLEGSGGLTTFAFTITRTGETSGEGSVQVSTVDGTATAPADYAGFSGQVVSFAIGQSQATVSVEVVADTVVEGDETFGVVLSNPSDGAFLGDGEAVGTIRNDDSATVAIGDVVLDEGDSDPMGGTTSFSFSVTLTGAVQGGFTVPFSTSDGTAAAPGDYATTSGTLTFAGTDGETQAPTVLVVGEEVVEPDEDFTVTLGVPSHADVTAAHDTGRGTIQNDDSATLTVDDVTEVEGDAGTTGFVFTVTLSGAVQGGFTVPVATADDTATAPGDYADTAENLTFSGTDGEMQSFTVPVVGDDVVESDETFFVALGAPSKPDITATKGTGLGTILNDEATLAIGDVTQLEGDAGTTDFTFTVTLSGDIHGGFTVPVSTADGTAVTPGDYVATLETLTFVGADGETQTLTVPVVGDEVVEPDEAFAVNLGVASSSDVTATDGSGLGTIQNDDTASLTLSDVTQAEGDAGTTGFVFVVTLSGGVQGGFTVPVSTTDGTATAPDDYATTSGTLTFTGIDGEMQTVTVPVVGNEVVEPDETFTVVLGVPSKPDITAADGGLGTIANDDGAARLEITKVVSKQDPEADTVTFTLAIVNVGDEPQTDDPAANELVDVLPSELAVTAAFSDSAAFVVAVDPGTNTVTGNGTIGVDETVTVTIEASVLVPPFSRVTNQATVRFDADHDGISDTTSPSDDPATAIFGDGTTFAVEGTTLEIPTLGPGGLLLLALALALAGLALHRTRI